MDKLFEAISGLAPEAALTQLAVVTGRLLADLDDAARQRCLMNLIGPSEHEKQAIRIACPDGGDGHHFQRLVSAATV